jgi:hypothetical protein
MFELQPSYGINTVKKTVPAATASNFYCKITGFFNSVYRLLLSLHATIVRAFLTI